MGRKIKDKVPNGQQLMSSWSVQLCSKSHAVVGQPQYLVPFLPIARLEMAAEPVINLPAALAFNCEGPSLSYGECYLPTQFGP